MHVGTARATGAVVASIFVAALAPSAIAQTTATTVTSPGSCNSDPSLAAPPVVALSSGSTATAERYRCSAARPFPSIDSVPVRPSAGRPAALEVTDAESSDTIEWDTDNDGAFDDPATVTFSAGVHRVRVRQTDADGRVGIGERTFRVSSVNVPPTVSLSPTTQRPRVGKPMRVTAYAADTDGTIASLVLDRDGDGTYETPMTSGEATDVTFASPGVKSLRVRATDDRGAAVIDEFTVDVHSANRPPRASIFANPSYKVGDTYQVYGYSTDDDGRIVAIDYDLDGDGAFETPGTPDNPGGPQVLLDTPGRRTVGVRATDDDGATAVSQVSFRVASGNPPPDLTLAGPSAGSRIVTAYANDADGIAQYAWDLDDDGEFDDVVGTGATTATIPGSAFGSFTIGLRVTDTLGAATTSIRTFQVAPGGIDAPEIVWPDNRTTIRAGQPISVLAIFGAYPGTLDWDLDGDGAFDDLTSPSGSGTWTFPEAGAVQIAVRQTSGPDVRTDRRVVYVSPATGDARPALRINTYPSSSPRVGIDVQVSADVVNSGGGTWTHTWDLDGDGDYDDATGLSATFTPTATGDREVRLRSTNGSTVLTQRATFTVHTGNRPPRPLILVGTGGPTASQTVRITPGTTLQFGVAVQSRGDDAITGWAWDLDGDGAFDDGTGVSGLSRTFSTAGTYRIRLRATDEGGLTGTDMLLVVVEPGAANRAPAITTASAGQAVLGTPTSLYAGAIDPDGDPVTYTWDLDDDGDFDDATGPSVTKTFTTAGNARVRVKAEDPSGASDVAPISVFVPYNTDAPSISYLSIPRSARPGEPVTLAAYLSSYDTSPLTVTWDLDGDGAFDDVPTPAGPGYSTWIFPAAGPVNVSVRVTDGAGRSTTRSTTVSVLGEHFGPSLFLLAATPTANVPTVFSAYAGGAGGDPYGPLTACTITWDLDGDGDYDDRTTDGCRDFPTVTFPTPGVTRTVGAKVTDGDGLAVEQRTTFTVGSTAPTATFTAGPNPASTGQTVTLTSTGVDADGSITQRAWDLDDDGEFDDATGPSATVSFSTPGIRLVGHKTRDNSGDIGIVYQPIEVLAGGSGPSAAFDVAPASPRVNQTITFTSTSTDPDGPADITSQTWDLDDDGAFDDASGTTATRSFTTAGAKVVRLRVVDSTGRSSTATRTVTVAANTPPVAGFTRTPEAAAVGTEVTFSSTATDTDGTITATAWDLDDDGDYDDATGTTARRTFTTGGLKTVRQKVTDNDGASATSTANFTITGGGGPTPSFTVSPEAPAIGQNTTFTSTSTDSDGGTIASVEWDFDGDGDYDDATGSPRVTVFATSGDHEIGLRVTDDAGNIAQTRRVVRVNAAQPPDVRLAVNRDRAHIGDTVALRAHAFPVPGTTIASYAFDLDGDGTFDAPTSSPTAQTTFGSAGSRTVSVRVTDSRGLTATSSRTITVSAGNEPPVLSLSTERSSRPRTPTGAAFPINGSGWDPDGGTQDLTTGAYDDGIVLWEWDLNGNGVYTDAADRSGATLESVTATLGAGLTGEVSHTVNVRVRDAGGATASRSLTLTTYDGNRPPSVFVWHWPWAAERAVPVHLVADASDDRAGALTYAWDTDADGAFDDGTTAEVTTTFASTGTKTVRVRVTDADGASTVQPYELQVTGAKPQVSLRSTPLAAEVGADVTLKASASDPDGTITSLSWDLDGDGGFTDASGDQITRSFPSAGTRTIAVKAVDDDGNVVITRYDLAVHAPITFGGAPTGLQTPTPTPTTPAGGSVPSSTTVDPDTGRFTLRIGTGALAAVPGGCARLDVLIPIRGAATNVVLLVRRSSQPDARVNALQQRDEAGRGTGSWEAHVDCLAPGDLLVEYDLPRSGGGLDHIGPVPIGAITLIDPQGVVYDEAAYIAALTAAGTTPAAATAEQKQQARGVAAIAGATVTLQRLTSGTWTTVNKDDPGISPNVNPQITGDDGLYRWDVSAGEYRVVVTKPGFTTVTSLSALIPPPKLDLHVPLHRNAAPVAGLDVVGALVTGQTGTFRSTSKVANGQIASTTWDFDNDGAFDDASGTDVVWTYSTAGAKTVRVRAVDADGEVDIATKTVSVADPAPSRPGPQPAPDPRPASDPQPGPPGGASSPPSASGPAPILDTTKPTVTLKSPVAKALRFKAAKAGLAFGIGCSEACKVTIAATIDKATAKRLKRKSTTVGSVSKALGPGASSSVLLKLDGKALKAASKLRSLPITVVLTAIDTSGNATTVTRKLTLRR